MIGSSNATSAGYGLHQRFGHHELNLWIGCPARSRTAKQLRALLRIGEPLDLGDGRWEPVPDDDEPTTPRLPDGFVWSTVHAGTQPAVEMHLDIEHLPTDWETELPTGRWLLSAEEWRSSGSPDIVHLELGQDPLPPYLVVTWWDDEGRNRATWPVNVQDRSELPPPAELAELPVEILLAALASSRPLPVALEHELRRREGRENRGPDCEVDPLQAIRQLRAAAATDPAPLTRALAPRAATRPTGIVDRSRPMAPPRSHRTGGDRRWAGGCGQRRSNPPGRGALPARRARSHRCIRGLVRGRRAARSPRGAAGGRRGAPRHQRTAPGTLRLR